MAAVVALAVPTSSAAAPGDPDGSLGAAGIAVVHLFAPCAEPCVPKFSYAFAQAVAIGRERKVLVAGDIGATGVGTGAQARGAAVRLSETGALDPSFGAGGVVLEPSLNIAHLFAAPDGALVAFGRGALQTSSFRFQETSGIARYTAAGLPDESFAPGGVTMARRNQRVVRRDGR
jgi:hypothetical protein